MIDKINIELKELTENIAELKHFIEDDNFYELVPSRIDRSLLKLQLEYMISYNAILYNRKLSLENKEKAVLRFNFGDALKALKAGMVIRRAGWNGKNIYVFRQIPAVINMEVVPKMQSLPEAAKILIGETAKHINYTSQCLIYNTETGRADSWVPSISDVFAEDWEIIELNK